MGEHDRDRRQGGEALKTTLRAGHGVAAALACLLSASCRHASPPAPGPAAAPQAPAQVDLRMYVYLDEDFVSRFGSERGAGRQKVNGWLWEVENQMRLAEFPVTIYIAGVGRWSLPHGAHDGRAIWRKYVPASWPKNTGANCMLALTGRKAVYWSGVSQWPRIFSKAQAAEPVDQKTVSLLCHEISHWFGAKDIIDAGFPERSVMNYRARNYGWADDGPVQWDSANRERMERAFARLPPQRG